MKLRYIGILTIVLLVMTQLRGLTAGKVNFKTLPYLIVKSSGMKPDKNLILIIVTNESKKILRISFNGDEGAEGSVNITNATHNTVKTANFELIKSPYYASIDITNLLPGTYNVELTTSVGFHTSFIIVK